MNILFAVISPEELKGYHAIALHFPIILLTGALIADMLNYFGVKGTLKIGHYLVILGLISCVPALYTGLLSAQTFNPNDALILHHRFLSITGAIFTSLYAGLRISFLYWKIQFNAIYYLILSVLLVLLFSWIRNSGETIHAEQLPVESHHSVAK